MQLLLIWAYGRRAECGGCGAIFCCGTGLLGEIAMTAGCARHMIGRIPWGKPGNKLSKLSKLSEPMLRGCGERGYVLGGSAEQALISSLSSHLLGGNSTGTVPNLRIRYHGFRNSWDSPLELCGFRNSWDSPLELCGFRGSGTVPRVVWYAGGPGRQ